MCAVASVQIDDDVKICRFLHEKRAALDAIELLNIFAKHKGMSFDVESNEDASTSDPDQSQPQPSGQQQPQHQQQQQHHPKYQQQQQHRLGQQQGSSAEVTSQQPSSSGLKWPGTVAMSTIDADSNTCYIDPLDCSTGGSDDNKHGGDKQAHLVTCPLSGQQQMQHNDI